MPAVTRQARMNRMQLPGYRASTESSNGLPRLDSLLVSVTEVCHVGCRHCGFIGSTREREPAPAEMNQWVHQACEYGVSMIIFTGGEPFERFEVLTSGVAAAAAFGVPVGIFTSSYWGTSFAAACQMLRQLPGVTRLYLSTDVFH